MEEECLVTRGEVLNYLDDLKDVGLKVLDHRPGPLVAESGVFVVIFCHQSDIQR